MATKRWKHFDDTEKSEKVETPSIDAYLEELIEVGRKHGFSLSHEDSQGGFLVKKNDPNLEEWLRDACDDTEVTTF